MSDTQEEQDLRKTLSFIAPQILSGLKASDVQAMNGDELRALRQKCLDVMSDFRRHLDQAKTPSHEDE